MQMGYARQLNDGASVEHFLYNCLDIGSSLTLRDGTSVALQDLVPKVRDAEIVQSGTNPENTLISTKNRNGNWRADPQRNELRRKIVKELIEFPRPLNDEHIKLGYGGAGPAVAGPVPAQRKAYLLTGLPASGKSSIVAMIADKFLAFVIDPDYAKRKLPEFNSTAAGANLVHEESSAITLSSDQYDGPTLLLSCLDLGLNIVRPMIGSSKKKIEAFREVLVKKGYQVHLTTIVLDRKIAAHRALCRFWETGRYVPLSYVFDDCANTPALIYYKYRVEACNLGTSDWASLGAISTDGNEPSKLDFWGIGNPAELY
jgi:predicted ABC-type ATPase